jgi:hypothetical protein
MYTGLAGTMPPRPYVGGRTTGALRDGRWAVHRQFMARVVYPDVMRVPHTTIRAEAGR